MNDWRNDHFNLPPKPTAPIRRRWPWWLALLAVPVLVIGGAGIADQAGFIDLQKTLQRWKIEYIAYMAGLKLNNPEDSESSGHSSSGAAPSESVDDPIDRANRPAPAASEKITPTPQTIARAASLTRGIDMMKRDLIPIEKDIANRTEQLTVHDPHWNPRTPAEREVFSLVFIAKNPNMNRRTLDWVNEELGNARTDMRNHNGRIKQQKENRDSLNRRIDKAAAEKKALP
jgi:hypothetical protein